MIYPKETWEWYGTAGHFICGRWCRFHLLTKVGPYMVSTVGQYVHPRHSGGNEKTEAEWLDKNWPGEDIGYQRKYETMVFNVSEARCQEPGCMCGQPMIEDWNKIEGQGYNDAKAATDGHNAMCLRIATEGKVKP